jgi:hypothetical protein
MIKIMIMAAGFSLALACGSKRNSSVDTDKESSETKISGTKDESSGQFGKWESDNTGVKFREDYELKQALSGYELVKYTRTDGGQYGGSSSTTKFTLCSDGTVRYYYQSLTSISVEGAGGSNASEDEDYGTWKAIENEKGLKLLMITSEKHGNTGFMEIRPQSSKVQMVWYNEWQEFLKKKIDC